MLDWFTSAFRSGDPQSVAMMYQTMVQELGSQRSDIHPADFLKQLEREFGLTLEGNEIVTSNPHHL